MTRRHRHRSRRGLTATLVAILPLALFLGIGLSIRLTRSPDSAPAKVPGVEVSMLLTEEPVCVEVGRVPKGSTLAEALAHEGVEPGEANAFLARLGSLFDLRRVGSDDEYRLLWDKGGDVTRIEFQPDDSGYFVVEKDSAGLSAWREEPPVDRVVRKMAGTVRGSLYASMMKQGLDPGLVATFCDVFSYDVDFATETNDGDAFECLVEERLRDGRRVGGVRLLSGSYRNGADVHEACWYEPAGAKGGYYRPSGEALKRAFLRSPLNYTRISSGYTHKRRHPIFKTVRPHLGVDYAAPTGTPVVSVADGVVQSAGWVNGYGKLVRVKHSGGIVTYYAHLSRFAAGIRAGARVDQNQVIGHVGQTGHATGPHLDFRVEVGGQFVNPLTFKSTGGDPLPATELASFRKVSGAYRDLIARLDGQGAVPEAEFAALLQGGAVTLPGLALSPTDAGAMKAAAPR
jgi:hypothetical protein